MLERGEVCFVLVAALRRVAIKASKEEITPNFGMLNVLTLKRCKLGKMAKYGFTLVTHI